MSGDEALDGCAGLVALGLAWQGFVVPSAAVRTAIELLVEPENIKFVEGLVDFNDLGIATDQDYAALQVRSCEEIDRLANERDDALNDAMVQNQRSSVLAGIVWQQEQKLKRVREAKSMEDIARALSPVQAREQTPTTSETDTEEPQ
jgi:hypothetical protein